MVILTITLGVMLAVLICLYGRAGFIRLASLELRGGWFAVFAALAQGINYITPQYRLVLTLVSIAFLAAFCWLNRRQVGIPLAMIGIALNMLVIAANGGHMPLDPVALAQANGDVLPSETTLVFSKNRVLSDSDAVLPLLGDRLLLPGPLAPIAVWSIGDVLLIAGVWWLLWNTMKGPINGFAGRRNNPISS